MEFEWDEEKRKANLRKHKIDFLRAIELFDGRPAYSYPSPRAGEERTVSIGFVDGQLVAIVWIRRSEVTRIISVRRARRGEKTRYQALFG